MANQQNDVPYLTTSDRSQRTINEIPYLVTGGGSGGGAAWGDITGTLADQTDLQSALNAKANASTTYTKTEVDAELADKQDTANLVTSVSASSTDTQYPSAKLLYDTVGNVETLLTALISGGGAQ